MPPIQALRYVIRRPIGLLIAAFWGLGVAYGLTIPPFESPDELAHLNTVRYIATRWELPPLTLPRRMMSGADVAETLQYSETKVFYAPPLYYTLGAVLVSWMDMSGLPSLVMPNPGWARGWPPIANTDPWNKNVYIRLIWGIGGSDETVWALYLLRLVSLMLGSVTVFATYTLARRLWADRPNLAFGAAVFVALNPQFLALSVGVTNDNLLIALSTLFFAHLVSCIRGDTPKEWFILGIWAGLALLTKQSALLLLPIGFLGALWQGNSPSESWKKRWRDGGIFLAVALAIGGWWYIRGALLYGDPLGVGPHFAGQNPLPRFDWAAIRTAFQTYWAAFGWGVILVEPSIYWGIAALMAAALIGWGIAARRTGSSWSLPTTTRRALVLLFLAFALNAAALVRWAKATGAPLGRLLFPTIAPVAVLSTYGLAQWARWRAGCCLLIAIAVFGLIFNGIVPWRYISPAFTLSGPVAALPETIQPVSAAFQNGIQLLGYEISRNSLQPGQEVSVVLYWTTLVSSPERCFVWMQLGPVDPTHYVVGQNPWLGGTLYPTDVWRAGEIVRQLHRLSIPDWAPAPGIYWIRLGLVDENGHRIPLKDGSGDMVVLGPWRLVAAAPPPPPACRVNYRLGEAILLDGYDVAWQQEGTSRQLLVTLHWRATQAPGEDYTVFVHLVDEEGNLVAQHDGLPRGGEYPASWWRVGERVVDAHVLPLERWDGGPLFLRVGMYHPETLERLPVYDREGHRLEGDWIGLPEILPNESQETPERAEKCTIPLPK